MLVLTKIHVIFFPLGRELKSISRLPCSSVWSSDGMTGQGNMSRSDCTTSGAGLRVSLVLFYTHLLYGKDSKDLHGRSPVPA